MIKNIILLIALGLLTPKANTCTNLLVTKGASTDGSTMITYAADSHVLFGELYFRASANNEPGDSIEVFEWETGKRIGKIAQAEQTYKVVGNMNEHQLVIAETTFSGRKELQDTLGMLDYGSLIYITLQRAKTAREAISLMDKLLSEYGYYSTGESFSIADTQEVWIMELIGKGVGNKGAVWVARKIPDGYICGHANQARITTFPLNDPENCMYSSDVISFAREQGYYEGADKDFSFCDAYAPIDFGGARFCEARVWSAFRRVNTEMEPYVDYAMGENLENRMPLWIKPNKKLTVRDVQNLMRDYYGGTPMDMTTDIGAGAFENIVRWRPLTWEIDSITYFNERAISTQQTAFSFVSQSRGWLPNSIGGILWFGVDDTYSTVYVPMYCSITEAPYGFRVGNGSLMEFTPDAAFWIFNQVSNFAYTRYNYMIPHIQEVQLQLENSFESIITKQDSVLVQLHNTAPEMVSGVTTKLSATMSEKTLTEWKNLYGYLFTRYMDGNVKTAMPGELNPKLEQPGYSEHWYRKLIEETGDKYHYKSDPLH